MSDKRKIPWAIEDHTLVKHAILRRYLQAWFPILASAHDHPLMIDGFAGPGEYEQHEPGSPVIAIETWLNRAQPEKGGGTKFIFIEKDRKTYVYLTKFLKQKFPLLQNYTIYNSSFDETMTEFLSSLEETTLREAPIFVFIDPFGVSHTPMRIISQLMRHSRGEVLITFMAEFVNRIQGMDYGWIENDFTELFGTTVWRERLSQSLDPMKRKQNLYDLYFQQLKTVGNARYIRSFSMTSTRNTPIYYLFYGTNSLKGLSRMKSAMLKADTSGGYAFSDVTGIDQQVLFTGKAIAQPPLEEFLQVAYIDKGDVDISTLEEFVLDQTPYVAFSETLRSLENVGELIVISSSRTQKGSFPPGTILRFLSKQPKQQSMFR